MSFPLRKVDQTLFGHGVGNCHVACLAMLTGIAFEEIPNFCVIHGESDWMRQQNIWLRDRGFAAITFNLPTESDTLKQLDYMEEFMPTVPWIAGGDAERPNGLVKHSVVYLGTRLFHDPNPLHRSGILRAEDIMFLVRTAEPVE